MPSANTPTLDNSVYLDQVDRSPRTWAGRSGKVLTQIVVVDRRTGDYQPLLEAAGELIDVVFCRSGDEALQHARRSPAAMWLINSRLEDMTGVELHALLRPHLNRTPVFVVADEYNPADEIACLSAGSVHFLCKPLSGEWLAELCPALSRLAA